MPKDQSRMTSSRFREYLTTIRRNDDVHEVVSFSFSNRENFRSRVRSIILDHPYEKAVIVIRDFRERLELEKLVLEEIYYPVMERVGKDLLTNEPFCICHGPVCKVRYFFGTSEIKNCETTFRTEQEVVREDGWRERSIKIDVRFGDANDRKALVNEIVKKHAKSSWKDGICEVLGRNEIILCQDFLRETRSLLDIIEVELKAKRKCSTL